MRSKCTNQDASVLMQAALMPLAGVKRSISRSGARVVVKFNQVEEALKPLTGGLNSGHLQFEEKDNRVQLAAPVKISHSFVSGVTSISALLARGKSLGGGQQRQTKAINNCPIGAPNVSDAPPPRKKSRVLPKVRTLPNSSTTS